MCLSEWLLRRFCQPLTLLLVHKISVNYCELCRIACKRLTSPPYNYTYWNIFNWAQNQVVGCHGIDTACIQSYNQHVAVHACSCACTEVAANIVILFTLQTAVRWRWTCEHNLDATFKLCWSSCWSSWDCRCQEFQAGSWIHCVQSNVLYKW